MWKFLLHSGEQFELYMDPVEYLMAVDSQRLERLNLKHAHLLRDSVFIFSILQDEMSGLLGSFVSGIGLTRTSQILFPVVDFYSHEIVKKLVRVEFLVKKLRNDGSFYFDDVLLEQLHSAVSSRHIASKQVCQIIAGLYTCFDINLRSLPFSLKEHSVDDIMDFAVWKEKAGDSPYLRPIFAMHEYVSRNLSNELIGFYFHGSLRTLDYIQGYSDFDSFAIVRKEMVTQAEKLWLFRRKMRSTNNLLFLLDILQHHGVAIITELDLLHFPQAYSPVPVALFDFATALGKSSTHLKFYERGSKLLSLHTLWGFCHSFRSAYLQNHQPKSAFDFKLFT